MDEWARWRSDDEAVKLSEKNNADQRSEIQRFSLRICHRVDSLGQVVIVVIKFLKTFYVYRVQLGPSAS